MIDIENNYKLVNDLLVKNNGVYLPPETYNRYAGLSSDDLFKTMAGITTNKKSTYGIDRKLDRRLGIFREVIPTDVVGGVLVIPSELQLITAIYTDTVIPIPIRETDEDRFAMKFHDPLSKPIAEDPVFKEDTDDSARIYPTAISKIIIEGLRLPKSPKYGYTITNRRAIFNRATSVDFEWDKLFETELTIRILQYAGISLESSQIIQLTEAKKDKE